MTVPGSTCAPSVDGPSVGDRVVNHQMFSINHPLYISFANQVADELEMLRQEAFDARKTAKKLAVTSTLPSEELDLLNTWYPEFDVAVIPLNTPVHPLWCASREAANELTVDAMSVYADKIVHFGGSRLANVLNKRDTCIVQQDLYDPVQADAEYSDSVNMHRMFQDPEFAPQDMDFDRREYDRLLRGEAYLSIDVNDTSISDAEGFCADLTIVDISPTQFATSMLQYGAEVGMGFFTYHPSMLVLKQGTFPGLGVSFEFEGDYINFSYPEGQVGVDRYLSHNWRSWIASHNFCVGEGEHARWFALELLDTRGCFMNFRMVLLEEPPTGREFRHALEVMDASDLTLVESWRLKDGLRGDPNDPSHWEEHKFLVSSRVERRVREFAMQLKPESFKRETIKKQIRVVNNRWVLKGSEVVVMPILDPRDIESLTTAIFSRAFVDRFESGALSAAMMDPLRKLVAFNSTSTTERFKMVAAAVIRDLYDRTLGAVVSSVRDVADSIVDKLTDAPSGKIAMVPPPSYRTFISEAGDCRTGFLRGVIATAGGYRHKIKNINLAAPGGTLLNALLKPLNEKISEDMVNVARSKTDYEDIFPKASAAELIYGPDDKGEVAEEIMDALAAGNELDEAPSSRYRLEKTQMERRDDDALQNIKQAVDLDPVATLNSLYLELFPAVAQSRLEFDTYHMSLDPQDRCIDSLYLAMPKYFGLAPTPRSAYRSNLTALNIPRKQNTHAELLNAVIQRNLSAPAIALPQENSVLIPQIWENFLRIACVDNAKEKLLSYQNDPVSSSRAQYEDWIRKSSKPSTLEAIRRELVEHSRSIGDCDVSQYLCMLKSDLKPTLSEKPVRAVTAPQVIVYHEKFLSSFYSSIFRVLVHRLQSLLRPEFHLNLLKDLGDIEQWVSAAHPYGQSGLQYLENDFSKFDKSQSGFVFELEEYVFKQLGLNAEMLHKWVQGHVECSLRAVSIGLSLHVMYQRKSGDATTAFGNGILNLLSVLYAYQGTRIYWGVFMGDDSLVCTGRGVTADTAVQSLAEIFNLSAKCYVTGEPYFASTFFLIDETNTKIRLLPDPIKRIERLSMHISADDPQWWERYISYQVSLGGYLDPSLFSQLARSVCVRYSISEGLVRGAANALASIITDFDRFRSLWEREPTVIEG